MRMLRLLAIVPVIWLVAVCFSAPATAARAEDAPPTKSASPSKPPADTGTPARAQPAPAKLTPAPVQEKPAREPASRAKPAGKAKASTLPPTRQEHVIYLPYTKLRDVFEDEDSSIVLPYSQFLRMWDRVAKPDRRAAAPPVEAVIARADYKGTVQGDLARLEATLDVDVLVSEWARLGGVWRCGYWRGARRGRLGAAARRGGRPV